MATKGRNRADIGSSQGFYPVTPDDGVDLPVEAYALCVAVGGALAVDRLDGQTVTITVPAGVIPIVVQRVRSTGTTATGITALT
jgi:hypothetical protein